MKRSVLFIFLLLLLAVKTAFAETRVGLVPARPILSNKESFSSFRFELAPGEEKKDEVAIVNLSEKEIRTSLFTEDKNSWLKIATGSLILKPEERKNVAFGVKVPQEAKPGDHEFYLKAGEARIKALVFVKGEAKKELEISSVKIFPQNDKLFCVLEIKNSGDLVVDSLSMRVTLKNIWQPWGEKETTFFWPLERKILPGETASFDLVSEKKLPAAGKFLSFYEIDYGPKKNGKLETLVFINWFTVLAGLVSGLMVIVILLFLGKSLVLLTLKGIKRFQKKKTAKPWLWKKEDFAGIKNDDLELQIRKIIRQEFNLFLNDFQSEMNKMAKPD